LERSFSLWKNSSTPPNARSAAVLTFNPDGSAHLNAGSVEMGQGSKSGLAQIVAERLKMSPARIDVTMDVNTQWSPEHWKTVASGTTFMVGQACLQAADDALRQIKSIAAIALRCPPEDLEVANERVFLRDDPGFYLDFPAIVHGYKYPNGNSIGGQIIGRGSFIMRHLTALDPDTGKGHPGPGWVVGAQAVQVELDTRDFSYRILKAAAVLDAGRVVNPKLARGVVTGGICMGLSMASREAFLFNAQGQVLNANLRVYKLLRYGEQPEYLVDFVETPMLESAYGARGLGEHGLVGAPAALANSLSSAAQVDVGFLPLIPECLWRAKKGVVARDHVRV
jgi:CO/xanthine dehydrogenase Mo-binding subunit